MSDSPVPMPPERVVCVGCFGLGVTPSLVFPDTLIRCPCCNGVRHVAENVLARYQVKSLTWGQLNKVLFHPNLDRPVKLPVYP